MVNTNITFMCRIDTSEKEDIYQLGVILLEVITGKRLFSASEIEDLKDEVRAINMFCAKLYSLLTKFKSYLRSLV